MGPSGLEGGRGGWRFWIDRGGTFTDLVGLAPDGARVVHKVLSARGWSADGGPGGGAAEVVGGPWLMGGGLPADRLVLSGLDEPADADSGERRDADPPTDPTVAAIRAVLGLAAGQPLPEGLVEEVRLGTTVATNALLERRVPPVLLLVNRGFADLAAIGAQHRPDIFALRVERPALLPHRVLEVPGRLAADGGEVEPFHRDPALEARLRQARAEGLRSCAVALLHAVVDPAHELAVGGWLEELGFDPVLLSHRVGGLPRLLPRLHTTLVEAAVRPVLQAYLAGVRRALGPATRLRVMTSAGVLQAPEQLLAKDTVLSGPAGGLAGAVAVARSAGLAARPILGFDMGGTSTDVFHLEGGAADWAVKEAEQGSGPAGIELQPETSVAGLQLQAPTLPIHTVAAGGGSVVRLEGGRLQVGPQSAGADPGPACYRRGGPLTVTDANLLLGRLPEGSLPPLFGPGGDQPPDGTLARRGFEALVAELAQAQGGPWTVAGSPAPLTPEALAQGARTIALERMAEAIRRVSIQRGHDIRTAVLVSYGGAGGQHACSLAERLGVARVLLHPLAGVLSAYGIGLSHQEALRTTAVQRVLEPALLSELRRRRDGLLAEASQALREAGDGPGEPSAARVSLELRSAGGERGLEVPWTDGDAIDALRAAFETRHRQRFGHVVAGETLVVERLQVLLPAAAVGSDASASGVQPVLSEQGAGEEPGARGSGDAPEPCRWVPLCLPAEDAGPGLAADLAWCSVPCWRREDLRPGQGLVGPAVVLEATGTTVLEPGWGGRVLADGVLLLDAPSMAGGLGAGRFATGDADAGAASSPRAGRGGLLAASGDARSGGHRGRDPSATPSSLPAPTGLPISPDPVRLELYNHRFSAIAEQMGVRLQQSSRSVNIRERLDFSCALFDGSGQLVANAPHIPVHLGSMGESVAALLAAIGRGEREPLRPGDAVASNDPYGGGTHLPDITVIAPVFAPDGAHQIPLPLSISAPTAASPTDRPAIAPPPTAAASPRPGGPVADGGGAAPLFYVACRGHHADVGGITPGSMPPFSRSILEEGLRLDNVPLMEDGRLDLGAWRKRLTAGAYPVRDPERLLADLQAQLAANRLGEAELHRLIRQRGVAEVVAAMGEVQRNAAEAVRCLIDRLQPGRHTVELDDRSRIAVAVAPDHRRRRVRVDFSGTSPQQDGNLNAPLAITKAVVLYVFRVLVARPIPLNAGCFEPIDLVVPPGCLLHPTYPAAVVGGNVETSQAVANALFGALGVLAAGQGTMNNLSFGNDRCQYYETVAGGSGAGVLPDGSGFPGGDAVQSHMTNSRLTDPEILEARFPVRLERFARRWESGGAGRWRGGDGVVRWLRALEPITLAILSGSRRVPPFGLAGGGEGQCGRNALLRSDGSRQELGGSAQVAMLPGDLFMLETPGGGGWGVDPRAQEAEDGCRELSGGSATADGVQDVAASGVAKQGAAAPGAAARAGGCDSTGLGFPPEMALSTAAAP